MLAYVFWHRPRAPDRVDQYERDLQAFHRSLAHTPPVGLRGSVSVRLPEIPWLDAAFGVQADGAGGRDDPGYEDWYLVDDFTALGVLNEAAVGRGHRTAHDRAAHGLAAGAAGLYRLIEGEGVCAARIESCSLATWVARPIGSRGPALADLLGDGMDRERASLWRRQLVLGPAPELCLLSREDSAGVAATRLPDGWSARGVTREAIGGPPD